MCPIGQVRDHPNTAICDHAPHVMEGRAVGAVELWGIEPQASSMRPRRSTN
jgi:hypothetical protein